jgi:hypothetical protein
MAELSKIKFNGAEYDLKDAVAREAIENKADKIFTIKIMDHKYDSDYVEGETTRYTAITSLSDIA